MPGAGNGIYSRSEAEVVLRAAAQDRGDLEFMDGDTQWSEYTVPGGENYTEYRFQLDPDAKELFSEGTHFPDDLNNIFHIRTTDRAGPNGEKVLFVEEIQSDWAQTGRSEGFMDQKAIDESQAALKSMLFEIDMFIEDPKLLKESGSFFGSRIKEARELAAMGPQYSGSVINNLVSARRDFERSLGPSAVTTRLVDRVKKDFSFDQKVGWLNKNYSDTVAAALKKEGFPDSDVQDYIDGKWDEKWLSANDTGNTKKVSLLNYFDKLASTDARIASDRRAAMGSPSPEFYRIKKARALEGSGSAKGEIDFDAMYDDVYVDLEKEVFKNMRAAGVSPDFPEWVEITIESSRPNVEKLEREKGKPSTGPFVTTTEGWNKLGVKRIMNKAAEEDYDMVAFSNGDIQFDRWGNENLKEQYDKTLPGVIKTVTGKRPDETIDIGEYKVPVIRLNDKVGKETIKERSLRPQKMFSSGVGITALGAGLLSGLAPQEAEASGVGSIFRGQRISTRVPTAKSATENFLTDNLIINRKSLEDAPKAFDINAEFVSRYPTVKTDATTSAGRADAFTAEAVDNLIWLYGQAPTAVRNIGKNWYVGANRIAGELAEKYGISHESASAVLAALSPQKDWYQNVSLAERVINGYKKSAGKMLDSDSLVTAREIYSDPKFANNIEAMATMPFDELDDVQKAMYVRSLDQMINPNGDRVGQAFSDKTGKANVTAWGSNSEIAKAIRVIEDPSIENISRQMGGAHKVRNFYNDISDPYYAIDSPELGDVTIDTHAVAADQIMPLSGNSVPVGAAFGTTKGVASSAQTGARGTYGLHADAYRIAARELGIQPRELQSVTWETVRSLFPKEFKTKGNVSEINEIWKLYNSGKLSKGLARELILDKAGGIPDPDWAAGLDTAASGQRGLGANTGELSFSGVPGGQTAGRANAGRNLLAAGFPIALISTLGIGGSEKAQAKQVSGLVPFDPAIHTPQDVGLGGLSSEYTMTVDAPSGQVAVIPSIWWDANGDPIVLQDQREAERQSFEYEQQTGKQFPRFSPKDYASADQFAQERSLQGGAEKGPLATYPSDGGMGVRSAPQASDRPEIVFDAGQGEMGVRSTNQDSDRPKRVIQGPPRTFPVERPTPGLPSLIGQLGLGAMSEIAGGVLGGAAGLGEYVRGGGLLRPPAEEPATAESIRDVREGVGEYVGGLYDAGPEAQELGQEIMQNVEETVSPFIDYAMKGDITDEYGINMVPLIAQKLGIPAYELLEKLYYMMPEREQEAVKSGSEVYL